MKNNFDLKKYLVENRLTRLSEMNLDKPHRVTDYTGDEQQSAGGDDSETDWFDEENYDLGALIDMLDAEDDYEHNDDGESMSLDDLDEQEDEFTVTAPKEWGMKSLQKGDFIYPDMYNRETLFNEETFWEKLQDVTKYNQKLKQFDPDAKKTNWTYTGDFDHDYNLKDTIFKITSMGPEKVKFMEFDMNMNPTHREYVAYIKDINDYLRPPYEISSL